jgi:lipopolysaccharide/colanic/teichoic acid biosynthesis glycosyltransferase
MTAASRVFNLICAASGLIVLSPVFALVAIVIKCDDGGPVFYSQPRVGCGFRQFRLLKFRSMVVNADRASLLTAPDDARTTRAGRWLRKYKLDELPQLWNVVKGEMQLVGPRPEVARYLEMFLDEFAALLKDPPGITDPASLAYRREEALFSGNDDIERQYLGRILPDKLRLSLAYQKRRNFFSDLRILFKTAFSLASVPASSTHITTN